MHWTGNCIQILIFFVLFIEFAYLTFLPECVENVVPLDSLFSIAVFLFLTLICFINRLSHVKMLGSIIISEIFLHCSLLKTVPYDVLEKGRAIADAYREPEDAAAPEILDPELKQLESIL